MKASKTAVGLTTLAFLAFSGCDALGADDRAQTQDSARIEEARYVSIGGIEQWITIRGDRRDAPILLLLHGGPAEIQSPLISTYEPFERSYVLVQWDQRGAGKTYGKNRGPDSDVSLDRLAQDGIDLSEHLLKHLGQRRLILIGHS